MVGADDLLEALMARKYKYLTEEQWRQAEILVEDRASAREIERTTGVYRKKLIERFPDAVWTKEEVGEYRSILNYNHIYRKRVTA